MSKLLFRILVATMILIACYIVVASYVLLSIDWHSECKAPPSFYDYAIDLNGDEIEIYTDKGREYVIHPDSLEEFIINDNI